MKAKYIILFLLISVKSLAQDGIFITPNINAGLLNPATTALNPSANIQYQFRDRYEQILIGSDFKYKKQRLGVYLYNDNQGYGRLIKNSIMANYAKGFQLSEHTLLHIGASAQLLSMSIHGATIFVPYTQLYIPNFSLGTILSHKNMFLGVALHNILEPNQSFYHATGPGTTLPRRYTYQLGGRINIYKKLYILPSIIYQKQGPFDMLLPSLQINCGPLILGASKFLSFHYPNTGVANTYIGYINNRIKISYAYSWNEDRFSFFNAHCISFTYFFKQKEKGSSFSELMRTLL